MMLYTSLLLAIPSLASAFCHHGTSLWSRATTIPKFGYEGDVGALGWAALSDTYLGCATGKHQSPVNLMKFGEISLISGKLVDLNLPYLSHGAEIENLGSTLEVMMQTSGASIAFNDKNASLIQFHFHTPSEHHIDGEYYPMEVHFVFEENAKLIVLGVPIEVGSTSDSLLDSIFAHLPEVSKPGSVNDTGALSFSNLQNHVAASKVWNYQGSLTTPPCSEVVTWLVVNDPILVGPDLYKNLKSVMRFNARYTQNNPGAMNLLELISDLFTRMATAPGSSTVI